MSRNLSPEETAEFFKHLSQYKDKAQDSYKYIIAYINHALSNSDYEELTNLIPYMTSEDGYYAFRYIGEARRIFRILSIISLEHSYNKPLFCSSCSSYEQLMEKYLLTLFALRRITMNLSPESVDEAIYYLQNQALTPISLYFILKDELILSNDSMYETIVCIFEDLWTPQDIQQFLMLVASMNNTPNEP